MFFLLILKMKKYRLVAYPRIVLSLDIIINREYCTDVSKFWNSIQAHHIEFIHNDIRIYNKFIFALRNLHFQHFEDLLLARTK